MQLLDLIKIHFIFFLRQNKIKRIFVIIQIALGIFIIIPSLNFIFNHDRIEEQFNKHYGDNIYQIEIYDQNINSISFEKQGISKLYSRDSINEILINHQSASENINQKLLDSLIDSEVINEEYAEYIIVNVVEPNYFNFFRIDKISGNFSESALSQEKGVVISKRLAEIIFGDLNCVGKEIPVGNFGSFKVLGIIEEIPEGFENTDNKISIMFFNESVISGNDDFINAIFIRTNESLSYIELNNLMESEIPSGKISIIRYMKDYYKELDSTFMSNFISLCFGILIMLTAFIGNFGIALAFFEKQMKSIGIYRIIGADMNIVIILICVENYINYFIGGVIGIGLSIPFKTYLDSINNFHKSTQYDVRTIFIVISITVLLSLIFSGYIFLRLKKSTLYSMISADE